MNELMIVGIPLMVVDCSGSNHTFVLPIYEAYLTSKGIAKWKEIRRHNLLGLHSDDAFRIQRKLARRLDCRVEEEGWPILTAGEITGLSVRAMAQLVAKRKGRRNAKQGV